MSAPPQQHPSQTKQQQQQQQQEQQQLLLQQQPTHEKLRRSWNNFEIKLIKAADAAKVDARKVDTNPEYGKAEVRQRDVTAKCLEFIEARVELRNLLNEAEANVKDNARELKALNLIWKSSGNCVGRSIKRRRKND